MICKNCNAEIAEGTKFCQNCGAMVEPEVAAAAPVEAPVAAPAAAPVEAPVAAPAATPVEAPVAGPGLVWGILGLAFACSFFASVVGIIFSAIGKSKAKKYTAQGYVLAGKDKVGNILSKVGLPVSIVMTVFAIIYFVAVGILIGSNL